MDTDLTSLSKMDGGQKRQMMEQVKTQLQIAHFRDVIQKMSDKCFNKCVPKPGSSLDKSELKCLAMCSDRYMEALELVARTYAVHVQKRE